MLYFGLDVQLRKGSVAGYTTDESWAYGPKEGVEAFESMTSHRKKANTAPKLVFAFFL